VTVCSKGFFIGDPASQIACRQVRGHSKMEPARSKKFFLCISEVADNLMPCWLQNDTAKEASGWKKLVNSGKKMTLLLTQLP
jgi:hypothetical protein